MPVSAGTVQFSYTGDGTTTVFPFPSRFLSNSDIIVGVDGVQVFTGFTVTGAGDDAGGNVMFSVAPVGATAITLIRAPSINQLLDFVNNQTVLAQNIDNGLDKLTIVAQYLSYLLDRALKLDQFDTALTGDFDVLDRRLKNVGAPIDSADAVRLTDVQDIVAAAGDVPLPTLGQIGYLMQATGVDTFGWISRAVALGAALEAIRGLTPAADRAPYFTSTSVAALMTVTSFARTLLDDADAATMRTTLGLGAMATKADVAFSDLQNAAVVTASETIAANLNDTTLPTSAAVAADRKFTWATVGNLLIGPSQDVVIPAGVTEIVVNVPIGVSLSGTDDFILRLGDSGGVKSTGYFGQSVLSATSTVSLSTDFRVPLGLASRAWAGHMRLHLDSALTWRWAFFGAVTGNLIASGAGELALSSGLTTLRFTRSGTDTFDAGTSLRVGYR